MTLRTILLLILLLGSVAGCGSGSGLTASRSGIWHTPSRVGTINGLAVGLISSGISGSRTQTINGISLEMGLGIMAYRSPNPTDLDSTAAYSMLKSRRSDINGVSLGLFGLPGLGTINGIAASPFHGSSSRVNGFSINVVTNRSIEMNGLMVGLDNSTWEMNGVQIGVIRNRTHMVHGIQVGFYNYTHHLHGVQIGVVNRVGATFTGVQLGLLNIGPPGIWPILSISL